MERTGKTTSHNVGQPPPQFFGTAAQGYGPQGGYPTQYGAPPLAPNMISHGHGHSHSHPQNFNVPSTTVGPSSPPPAVNYHNERVQRQSLKLKKKLESKTRNNSGNSGNSVPLNTPPSSPRKDNNNIRKLKDRNQNEASATENEGEKEGEVKDDQEVLAQLITDVKLPQVQDISTRSANISWSPVEPVIIESKESDTKREELDISYEVLVGEKGKVKHKYVGKDCHYRVVDLQPGKEYWIRLSALVRQVKTKQAGLVEFRTETCPPDVPLPPEVSRRNKNSITLKWEFPDDNGSHITHFVLECDDGQGTENFTRVFEGRNRMYTVNRLQAATTYAVRLAAFNKVGSSGWSEVVNVTTLGNPPGPPAPPSLREAFVTKLSLYWSKTSDDQIYTLQICEPDTGHGFRNVYRGPDNEYTCTGLLRSTIYRFRLQTENDDGVSRWSDEVSYSTASDRPIAPLRPSVKGRIHPFNFRIRWDPPADNGGSPVTEYYAELDSGQGFVPVWSGSETEFVCDKLQPGTTYRVRVSASNTGGRSDFSDPCNVTTEAVCPGPCAPPILHGKPKSNSLQLRWDPPEFDGGAMISQYEVNMTNPDGSTRIAYVGRDTECLVASLLPGRSYVFQIRSSNRIGPGPWSESLRVLSGAGVPDAPSQLQLTNRTPQSVLVSWNEPVNNGSPIVDYKLEMGLIPKVKRSSSADSLSTTGSANDELSEQVELERLQFLTIYSGVAKIFEMKGLQPATTYRFRVQASNSVGLGAYSSTASITTLASSPGVVSGLRCVEAHIHNLLISWNKAHSNGSPITNYNIEVGDKMTFSTPTADTTFSIENLHPDTSYRIRVQAVNAIGAGPFSSTAKFSTRPLPPRPPQIECAVAGYNNLKLRWGDGRNIDFTQYSLEMAEANSDEFYLVYEGTSHSYKVPKLSESTLYKFRICARNDAGEGPYSDVRTFSTTRAPPPPLKKPDVLDLTETSCRIVWSTYRLPLPNEQVAYQVEVVRTKDHEHIVMQRCLETELVVSSLEPGTEHSVRIYPVRLCDDGEILGAYSPTKEFTTLRNPDILLNTTNKNAPLKITDRIRKPLTDQQIIMMIMAGFFFIVMLGSYVLQRNFFP